MQPVLTRVARTARSGLTACLAFAIALLPGTGASRAAPSLERMIGQMIMVGFDGTNLGSRGVRRTIGQLRRGEIGGVILLRRNIASRASVRKVTDAFRRAAAHPPLIAVDQEGGRVARLTPKVGFRRMPSHRSVARGYSPAEAQRLYFRVGRDLAKWGFNLNLGPVVDLDVNPRNPIIGRLGRSFSPDAVTATTFARAFVRGHRSAGVLTALKHFPGHGSSTRDSHLGAVDVSRTWSMEELRPYADLVATREVDIVMTGHLLNTQLTGKRARLPATLSRDMIDGILRDRIGFDGVVMADDLQMRAITKRHDDRSAALAAVRAGVDILLYSNDKRVDPRLVGRVTRHIAASARKSRVMRSRIREAYRRIVTLKRSLGTRRAALGAEQDPDRMPLPDDRSEQAIVVTPRTKPIPAVRQAGGAARMDDPATEPTHEAPPAVLTPGVVESTDRPDALELPD